MSLTEEQRDSLLAWVSFDTDEGEAGFLEEVEELITTGQVSALEQAATQIRDEADAANGKVPERYFSGLMDAAAYLTKRAAELRQTR